MSLHHYSRPKNKNWVSRHWKSSCYLLYQSIVQSQNNRTQFAMRTSMQKVVKKELWDDIIPEKKSTNSNWRQNFWTECVMWWNLPGRDLCAQKPSEPLCGIFLHQEKDFGLNPATNEYNRVFLLTPVGFRFCCLFGDPEDASTTMLCAQLLCGWKAGRRLNAVCLQLSQDSSDQCSFMWWGEQIFTETYLSAVKKEIENNCND